MTHTSKEQQEVLMKLADDYAKACFDQALHLRITDDKPEAARKKLEKELHRLHAHVQELEAQLEAVGAGGVQPLRKTVAASACSGCGSCQKQCQGKEGQAQGATVFDSTHSMSQNASKDDMLKAVIAENEGLKAQLAAAQQGVRNRVLVDAGALQMVVNALRRDALEGRPSRGEMTDELLSSATQPAAQGLDAQQLHNDIMNLPAQSAVGIPNSLDHAYALGHRDARHAAAKLVLAAQAKHGGAA